MEFFSALNFEKVEGLLDAEEKVREERKALERNTGDT
ncbi:MAG: hypothetical protein FD174_2100 [Geobacteraceae bacterium]|nr:MAG: hypothetical protein FD174_2100 [Geobacteraceae bacterium]